MCFRNRYLLALVTTTCLVACTPEAALTTDPAEPMTEVSAEQTTGAANSESLAAGFENPYTSVAEYLTCLRDKDVMLISAHRGGPVRGFPENAIETFENTLDHGPMLIETDVRTTADGVFILLHDEDLERTTNGTGLVSETTYTELQDLNLRDNRGRLTDFTIPTLEQALDWARDRAILQLDVKRGTPVDGVVDVVAAMDALRHAMVITYTTDDALRAASADPDATISVQIFDTGRLDSLERQGLPASRITAWTGTQGEEPALWAALNARGVSAAWGSFRTLDEEVERTGDASQYARLATDGLNILSSDLHLQAYDAVEKRQNTKAAVTRCNG
ncbi:glycerophosphodiester phosphodiesterase family protein [Parvularcula sp. IMCC14364]|uniref:glycerophosphodiester phosphodiesterase family protein n=1 Tax=Parvularcula sp. IMCC14364 TaxID=3067902 RepID=UPI002741432B|nr:glycerophosphodiester phosphodiesterase family protein [Parvularcula sp. IMCC14364]